MAREWYYKPGDNWILDDLSGFKIRRSRARTIPGGQTGGAVVAPGRWEPQQPQDFVRGIPDVQLPDLVRPRQQNRYTVVATFVTAPSPRLTYPITVDSADGFSMNDNCYLMLDSGENALVTIGAIVGKVIYLATPLTYSVGTLYGDPIENTLLFFKNGGPINIGLRNNNGVLEFDAPYYGPLDPGGLSAGQVWNNSGGGMVGPIAVVPGGSGAGQSFVFGQITAGGLLGYGAGGVQTTPGAPGSGIIWNNGGELAIS